MQVFRMSQSALAAPLKPEEKTLKWSGAGRSPLNSMVRHWHSLKMTKLCSSMSQQDTHVTPQELSESLLIDQKQLVRSSLQFLAMCALMVIIKHQAKEGPRIAAAIFQWRWLLR